MGKVSPDGSTTRRWRRRPAASGQAQNQIGLSLTQSTLLNESQAGGGTRASWPTTTTSPPPTGFQAGAAYNDGKDIDTMFLAYRVSITAVPEPANAAMPPAGLGLLAVAMRRRQRD